MVIDDDDLDNLAETAKLLLEVPLASADREAKDTEDIRLGRILMWAKGEFSKQLGDVSPRATPMLTSGAFSGL